MKIKRILAKVMAFVMAFAAISIWQAPIEAHAATPIQIGFNEVSITVPVAEGQTASAIALDSEISVGQVSAAGGRITLGVVATEAHAGRDVVVQLAIFNALQDTYFLVLRVEQAPLQDVSFRIVSPSDYVDLIPGVASDVDIRIQNSTTYHVSQVRIMPWALPNPYFTVEVVSPTTQFSLSQGGSRDIVVRITPRADIPVTPATRTRTIPIEFSFRDNRGGTGSTRINLPVRIVSPEDARVTFSNISIPSGNVQAHENFTITATLENISNVDARNVAVGADNFDANFNILSPSTVLVGTIPAGQTRDISFTFSGRTQEITRSRSIDLTLEFDVADDEGAITTRQIWINIEGEDGERERAQLEIVGITAPPAAQNFLAGQEAEFTVTIRNTGVGAARGILLAATPEAGIQSLLNNRPRLANLEPGESYEFNFSFTPRRATATGFHVIDFALTYNDGVEGQSSQQSTGMSVYNPDDEDEGPRASLQIVSIAAPGGEFLAGQEGRFTVMVTNVGEATATNVRLATTPDAGLVSRLQSIQSWPVLEAGQSRVFEFAFAPRANTATGFHNVGFTLTYHDGEEEAGGFRQYSGMLVYLPEDENAAASVPRVMISDFTVDSGNPLNPTIVMANTEFDLSLVIENTHHERTVGNIRVTWEVEGVPAAPGQQAAASAVFTPIGASNAFFIPTIAPGGAYEHHLRLFAIPDAPPMAHTIIVNFDYEDDNGAEHRVTERIGVNVRQISTLEIGDIFIGDWQQVGASIWLNFSVHNTSRSQIWNTRVRFEGDAFDTSNADEPFGNMGAGFASFFMGTVTPLEPGLHTLYMVATFEDTMAEVHEIRRAFEINVGGGGFPGEGFPGEGGDFRPEMPDMENPECPECHNWFTIVEGECMVCGWSEGGSFFADNLWIFIVGGAILIVGGGILTPLLIIRAKRKKSQFGGEQYEEVDEDF